MILYHLVLYRLAWAHTTESGYRSGRGPEQLKLTPQLKSSVVFGNNAHGAGSHWIERFKDGVWSKVEGEE